MQITLSSHVLSNELHCPDGKTRVELCDKAHPGLYVEVRATSPGQGTYYLRYKDTTGKTCHQKIGRTTDIDLADARKRRKHLRAEIPLGADPRGEAKARKEVPTLDGLHRAVLAVREAPEALLQTRRGAVPAADQGDLRQPAAQPDHPAADPGLPHGGAADGTRPGTCDHHLKLLKRVFNLAVEWGVSRDRTRLRGCRCSRRQQGRALPDDASWSDW